MSHRAWRAGLAAALLVVLGSPAAQADIEGFDAQTFRVPTDSHGFITMNGARTPRFLEFTAGLGANWAHNPVQIEDNPRELVQDRTDLNLFASVGILEFLDAGGVALGVHAPIIVDNHGRRFDDFDRDLPSGGFGDIEANVKATFLDHEEDVIGFFARMAVIFPLGEERNLTSNDQKISLRWQAGIDKVVREVGDAVDLRFGVELGYEWIDGEINLGGIQVDDRFRMAAGAGISPGIEGLWLILEATAFARAGHAWDTSLESPIEVGAAIKYDGLGFLSLTLGTSAGINEGVGAPDFRLFTRIAISVGGPDQ
jgi:hypothetical protein